jgi:ketosteroid isomerase-like protein
MKKTVFANARDAERAFYHSFQNADLDAMMSVWAEDEDVYCVHPAGARLGTIEQIRESWRQIFASGQTLRFELRQQQYLGGRLLSLHSVYEHITVVGQAAPPAVVIATNVYLNTESGWRMIVHHGSAVAGAQPPEPKRTMLH